MLTMRVRMKSSALKALSRLTNIKMPEKLTKPISERLKEEAQERYRRVWRQRSDEPHNVYGAVKKVVLGQYKRGHLTGSTLNAIDNFYGENFAGVGFNAFSWPTGSGRAKAPVQDVLDELNSFGYFDAVSSLHAAWGGSVGSATQPFKFKHKKHSGQVSITWTTSGLAIKWPGSVQYLFKDMFFRTEPFEAKTYNKGRWTVDKFFNIDEKTANWAVKLVGAYIVTEYFRPEKETVILPVKESTLRTVDTSEEGDKETATETELADSLRSKTALEAGVGGYARREVDFDKLFKKASEVLDKDVMDWVRTLTQQQAEEAIKDILSQRGEIIGDMASYEDYGVEIYFKRKKKK